MFISDRFKKTVRIPVFLTGGQVVQLDGSPLPKIRNGSVGELILDAYAIEDQKILQALEGEQVFEPLSKGESVLLGVNPTVVLSEKIKQLIQPSNLRIASEFLFVEVKLREPLKLRTRGTKSPVLEPCSCSIPILQQEAKSLNHAFTLISTEFETQRISHTGNVFQRGFVKHKDKWVSLDNLRGFRELRSLKG